MRISATQAALAFLAITATNGVAQSKANFGGTWKLVTTAEEASRSPQLSPPKPGATGHPVDQFTITQDGRTLKITSGRTPSISATYALDGSETTNYVKARGELIPQKCHARWQGDQLILTGEVELTSEVRKTTLKLSYDANGALVVEYLNDGKVGRIKLTNRYTKSSSTIT